MNISYIQLDYDSKSNEYINEPINKQTKRKLGGIIEDQNSTCIPTKPKKI
jgi:hypothetical protein